MHTRTHARTRTHTCTLYTFPIQAQDNESSPLYIRSAILLSALATSGKSISPFRTLTLQRGRLELSFPSTRTMLTRRTSLRTERLSSTYLSAGNRLANVVRGIRSRYPTERNQGEGGKEGGSARAMSKRRRRGDNQQRWGEGWLTMAQVDSKH